MGKRSGGGRRGRPTTKFDVVSAPSDTPSRKAKKDDDRLRLAPAVEKNDNDEDMQREPMSANANDETMLDDRVLRKDRHDYEEDNEGAQGLEDEAVETVQDIEQPTNNAQEVDEDATLIVEAVLAPSPSPAGTGDDILVVEGQLRPTKEEEEMIARRQSYYLIGVIICILSGVPLVLSLTFTLREQEKETIVRDLDAANSAPSMAPTSLERNLELEQQVIQMLQPWLDEEALKQNASSPEAKALHWIVYEDEYLSLETRLEEIEAGDLLQRFSLVAFYYSTGGDQTWFSTIKVP